MAVALFSIVTAPKEDADEDEEASGALAPSDRCELDVGSLSAVDPTRGIANHLNATAFAGRGEWEGLARLARPCS
jgi:hypothetical protein